MIKRFIDKYKSSEFLRNVITLMTGTGLSQVITIGVTVILTRIYTPDHFGLFALFMSVFSIIGNPATGKYDKAILLPKDDDDSTILTIISIGLAICYASVVFVIFFFFGNRIAEKLDDTSIAPWLLLVPIFIILNSIANSILVWLNRKKEYKSIVKSRVTKSIFTALVNLAMGVMLVGAGGLILGEIVGWSIMVFYLVFVASNLTSFRKINISKSRILSLLNKYKDFPKFNIFSDLINMISAQLPVILFTSFYGVTAVGFYSLTKRVLDAPINLMSSAVMEVFRQKASEDYSNQGNCKNIFIATFKRLLVISIIPLLLFLFLAPWLFTILFGEEWVTAGRIAQVLSIMYLAKFVISPLTYVYYIADKQKEDFYIHIYILVSIVLSLYSAKYFDLNLISAFLVFSINYFIIYLFTGYRSYLHSLGTLRNSRNVN